MGSTGSTPWNVLSDMIQKKVGSARERKQKMEDAARDNQMKIIMEGVQAHAKNGTLTDDMIQQSQEQMQKLVPKESIPVVEGWHKLMGAISKKKQATKGQGGQQSQPGQQQPQQSRQPMQDASGQPIPMPRGNTPMSGDAIPGPPGAGPGEAKPAHGMYPTADEIASTQAKEAAAKNVPALDLYKQETKVDQEAKAQSEKDAPKNMLEGLTAAGFTQDEAKSIVRSKLQGAAGRPRAMHPVRVTDPNDPTRQLFGMQSTTPDDEGGFPIYGTDGQIIANPTVLAPAMLPTQHTGEMPVWNPDTNQFEQQPTHSSSQKVVPGAGAGSKGAKPTVPPSLLGPKAKGTNGSGNGASAGSAGRHGIPARQFNILQKQATSIDEARSSLVGNDPNSIGGLSADIQVFNKPASVKKLSDYFGLVNAQLESSHKEAAGHGTGAVISWYFGVPQKLIDLQQGALRDSYSKLSPDEQRFADDYYRVMGTIGGMRAATGAGVAQWSFRNLQAELPTPGVVTNLDGAKRRIANLLQETDVVAKRNPLLRAPDAKGSKGAKGAGANVPANLKTLPKKLTPDQEAEQYLNAQ